MSKFYYGGQAVMEGVMMRGRQSVAVAIRRPAGDIYVHEEVLNSGLYSSKLVRLPFVRGIVLLWEMLVLGTRLMTLSANVSSGAISPEEMTTASKAVGTGDALKSSEKQDAPVQIGGASLIITVLISLVFAIALFFVGPLLLTSLLSQQIGNSWLSLVVEGAIRLLLLVGYLYLIGRMADVQRLFGYHGAEHKTINAMEQGDPLDVAHVRLASRVHTRCGTGFLLLVMVVSIFVFAFIGTPALIIKIAARIILVPVVAGIAYELMRLGAANYRFRIVRWLLAPGLALQGLTTREPDDSMIECAIASLQRVMLQDEKQEEIVEPALPAETSLALLQ